MKGYLKGALCSGILLLGACNKKDDATATPSNPSGGGGGGGQLTASTPTNVSMDVGGTTYNYGSAYLVGNGSSGGGGIPPDLSRKSYSCFFHPASDYDQAVFSVDMGMYQFLGLYPEYETFREFFDIGEVPFGDPYQELEKVSITWWDGTHEWSTTCGSGEQAGSEFKIMEIVEVPFAFDDPLLKMRVTFNCTFYNCVAGTSREVTNGTAVLVFDNM